MNLKLYELYKNQLKIEPIELDFELLSNRKKIFDYVSEFIEDITNKQYSKRFLKNKILSFNEHKTFEIIPVAFGAIIKIGEKVEYYNLKNYEIFAKSSFFDFIQFIQNGSIYDENNKLYGNLNQFLKIDTEINTEQIQLIESLKMNFRMFKIKAPKIFFRYIKLYRNIYLLKLREFNEYYLTYEDIESLYRTKRKVHNLLEFFGSSFYEALYNKMRSKSYNDLLDLGVKETTLRYLYSDLKMQEYLLSYWAINNFDLFDLEPDDVVVRSVLRELKKKIKEKE
jgi:hypothetical protein